MTIMRVFCPLDTDQMATASLACGVFSFLSMGCRNGCELFLWTTPIVRTAARDARSAPRAIAHPAPIGVNTDRAPVAAGWKFSGRSLSKTPWKGAVGIIWRPVGDGKASEKFPFNVRDFDFAW